jgi:hypothetical protein
MADYYSLLARKIGSLPQSTPQGRQAVYELARKALFNQLRAIQPPVAEQVIQNEGRALDEAIARLEIEAVAQLQAANVEASPAAAPETNGETKTDEPAAPREQQRPAAPLPPLPEAPSGTRRVLGIVGILLILVGAVALAALHFRERPEDLAKLKPEDSSAGLNDKGKFADRVDGGDQSGATQGGGAEAGVPVAQKAQMFVASVEHPEKVDRIFTGSVVWRLDNLGGGEGEPIISAIRGDIDFPDAKFKATLLIQKNLDAALSASHTITVSFSAAPDGAIKGVKAIAPLQMRRPEAQSGDKLNGIPVEITANNFLIGLMRGDAEAKNLKLLRSPWVIDLPMQLSDGRVATINLEKGSAGDRVFADAIESWSH